MEEEDKTPSQEQIEEEKPEEKPTKELNLLAPPKYEVRPNLSERFQELVVREIIDQTMRENLTGRTYSGSQAEKWVKVISNTVRERVNSLDMQRYKVIVQVFLGEMRGAGFKSGVRCLWDSECDNFTSHTFYGENIFCNTIVYGLYFY